MSFFKKTWSTHADLAEDFGSFCLELWVSKPVETLTKPVPFLAIDFLRRKVWAKKTLTLVSLEEHKTPLADPGPSPEEWVRLGPGLIRKAKLSQRGRAMMILHFEWGFDTNEIADVFGISRKRAWAAIKETLRELKAKGV